MELVMMIMEALEEAQQTDPTVTMADFIIGASSNHRCTYALLNIHPAHDSKFAVELIGGLVFIFLCGVFG
jgi:hypothetical protein